MPEFQKPPRLNIKCTSADCENELHCFKQLKKMTEEQRGLSCVAAVLIAPHQLVPTADGFCSRSVGTAALILWTGNRHGSAARARLR